MATTDVLTQAEAARALGITTASQTADTLARLDLLNTAVSNELDRLCGAVIQRAESDDLDGGNRYVWTKRRPVANVTSLVEYDATTATTLTSSSNTDQPAAGFQWDEQGKVWRRNGNADAYFPVGRRNVVVGYTAGRYTHTTASDAGLSTFKQAAALILRDCWQNGNGMGTDTYGGGGEESGAFITLGPELLNRVKGLLFREMEAPVVAG